MKQIVRFEMYGVYCEMNVANFVDMCMEQCKAMSKERWADFCENDLRILSVEEV